MPEGKLRLRFQVSLSNMGRLPSRPRPVFRVADVRFARLPVTLEGNLAAVTTLQDARRVGQRYPLTLTNRTQAPQEVRLWADASALRHFRLSLSERKVRLAPGESRTVLAEIAAPRAKAAALPPLTCEEATVYAGLDGAPDTVTTWYRGFMVYRVIGAVPVPERPFPRLMPEKEAKEGRDRLAGTAPPAKLDPRLERAVQELLAVSPEPPDTVHGNPNSYFNPDTNSPLRFLGPGKHWSEKDAKLVDVSAFPVEVQRAAAYAHHGYLSNGALKLAEAGWQSADRRYFRKAAEILLAYARKYPAWPYARPAGTAFRSKVGWAVLQESWWYAPLPRALDLVRASGVLTPEEDRRVVADLILPAAIHLRLHRSVANQQAEYNRGFGVGALVAGHWPLAAEALHNEYGLRAQWAQDFDADGWTMERDISYHWAALMPFLEMAETYQANGVPVFDKEFKRLFDAPLAVSPDLVVRGPGAIYRTAFEHYRDPLYQRTLAAAEGKPAPAPAGGFPNSVLPATGITVLRAGTSDADLRTFTLYWGCPAHRGGQVPLDPKITWRGLPLNEHVFRIAYGYKQSGFSYTAAAGNALVVDGAASSMLRADQVALLDGATPAGRWTSPLHRPLYPGVEWSRTAALCGDTVLVLDQVAADRPRRFDAFTFLPGDLAETGAWVDAPNFANEGSGYAFFEKPQSALPGNNALTPLGDAAPAALEYRLEAKSPARGQLTLLGSEGMGLMRMQGYIRWHPVLVPVVVRRVENARTCWLAAAYTGRADEAAPRAVVRRMPVRRAGKDLPPEQALALSVEDATGRYLVLTSAFTGPHQVDGQTVQGPLSVRSEK